MCWLRGLSTSIAQRKTGQRKKWLFVCADHCWMINYGRESGGRCLFVWSWYMATIYIYTISWKLSWSSLLYWHQARHHKKEHCLYVLIAIVHDDDDDYDCDIAVMAVSFNCDGRRIKIYLPITKENKKDRNHDGDECVVPFICFIRLFLVP